MRGEYRQVYASNLMTLGSPPHAWRILAAGVVNAVRGRITSTCVENTMGHVHSCVSIQDHLHMRGEYAIFQPITVNYIGSPPHAWRIQ